MCIKKKKLYEGQLEQIENNILRVNEQQMMLESNRATVETVAALRNAAQATKTTLNVRWPGCWCCGGGRGLAGGAGCQWHCLRDCCRRRQPLQVAACWCCVASSTGHPARRLCQKALPSAWRGAERNHAHGARLLVPCVCAAGDANRGC